MTRGVPGFSRKRIPRGEILEWRCVRECRGSAGTDSLRAYAVNLYPALRLFLRSRSPALVRGREAAEAERSGVEANQKPSVGAIVAPWLRDNRDKRVRVLRVARFIEDTTSRNSSNLRRLSGIRPVAAECFPRGDGGAYRHPHRRVTMLARSHRKASRRADSPALIRGRVGSGELFRGEAGVAGADAGGAQILHLVRGARDVVGGAQTMGAGFHLHLKAVVVFLELCQNLPLLAFDRLAALQAHRKGAVGAEERDREKPRRRG